MYACEPKNREHERKKPYNPKATLHTPACAQQQSRPEPFVIASNAQSRWKKQNGVQMARIPPSTIS